MPERVVETRSRRLRVLQAEEAAAAGTTPVAHPRARAHAAQAPLDPHEDARRRGVLRPAQARGRAGPPHRVRERVVPQHRRVLEPAVADDHDPRRHLHAFVSVLRRAHRPPAAGRSRASPNASPDARPSSGCAHTVITCVDRDDLPDGGAAHWAATIRAVKRAPPEHGARGADRRLQGRHRRGRHRARRRPRRVRAQPRDRAATVTPGARAGELRALVRDPRARQARAAPSPRPA